MRVWRSPEPIAPDPNAEFSYRHLYRDQPGWRGWVARHNWLPLRAIETDLAWVGFIIFSVATMLTHNTAVLFPITTNLIVLPLIYLQRKQKTAVQAPSLANWLKAQLGILLLWSPWLIPFMRQASGVANRFWIPEPTWAAVAQAVKSFLNASAPMPDIQAAIIWSLYGLGLGFGLLHFRKKLAYFWILAALFSPSFPGRTAGEPASAHLL